MKRSRNQKFEVYINDYNFENFLIVFLIFRNQSFAIIISLKKLTLLINYKEEINNDEIIIFKKRNINVFTTAFNSFINLSFNIFLSSIFFYMNYIQL